MKDVLLVGLGSFLGGSARYLVTLLIQSCTTIAFPLGTMTVNIAGCFIFGLLTGLNWTGNGMMTQSTKLLLTTGFCGGFTTFSTFMNEGTTLIKDGQFSPLAFYAAGSLVFGFLAVLAGNQLAKAFTA